MDHSAFLDEDFGSKSFKEFKNVLIEKFDLLKQWSLEMIKQGIEDYDQSLQRSLKQREQLEGGQYDRHRESLAEFKIEMEQRSKQSQGEIKELTES